jgi:hypothetical protein
MMVQNQYKITQQIFFYSVPAFQIYFDLSEHL